MPELTTGSCKDVVQQFNEHDDWVADLLVTDDLQAAISCVLEGA